MLNGQHGDALLHCSVGTFSVSCPQMSIIALTVVAMTMRRYPHHSSYPCIPGPPASGPGRDVPVRTLPFHLLAPLQPQAPHALSPALPPLWVRLRRGQGQGRGHHGHGGRGVTPGRFQPRGIPPPVGRREPELPCSLQPPRLYKRRAPGEGAVGAVALFPLQGQGAGAAW